MKSCCLLLPCLTLVAQAPQHTPLTFDVSAMEKAFEIMDILERDQEPSEGQWDALLKTPGYATMLNQERNRGPLYYRDCFRIACKPSLNAEYEATVKAPKDGWEEVMAAALPHFRKAKENRKKLEASLAQLKTEKLDAKVSALAKTYFPSPTPHAPISIAFILFAPDARGYEPIIFDLLLWDQLGKEKERVLAHELHHAWRNQLEAKRLSNSESALWVLKQIMLEGIADRINVAPALSTPEARATFGQAADGKDYLKHLDRCPEIIRAMDALLTQMAKHPAKREALGQELEQMVPRSGHLPGFYMASLIEAQLGKSALIQDQLNPATFFALYNKAAAKEGKAPRFSKEAMAYLNHLGRRFEVFKL